jgi:NitT/TauT family transport system permease protein
VNKFFELRGQLDKHLSLVLGIIGFIVILLGWSALNLFHVVKPQILPPPWKVLAGFPELHFKYALIRNLSFSIWINVWGYVEAVAVSVIIGFILGLIPLFRKMFSPPINATRFIPMPAVTGICIAIFGIDTNFKIQFLALGIIVYMIPVVIQRIDEVDSVYDHTAITLGASYWQRIWHVFIPEVSCRLIDDIKVLTAISWTYIIVAEMINAVAGVGYLSWLCGSKSSRMDLMYALLFVIIIVGLIQDKAFSKLDKILFRHKYL